MKYLYKVLQIIDGYGWGGTKDQMYLLTERLTQRKVEVEVALSAQFTELKERLDKLGVKYHEYQEMGRKSKWKDGMNLARIINEGNYQIAIANSPSVMNHLLWARPFIRNKPRLIAVKRSGKMSSFFSRIFKYSYADRIVVVSDVIRENMEKQGFAEERLLTIRSGIDLGLYSPALENREVMRRKLGIGADKKVFLQVANWNEKVKAQPELMRTFARLSHPDAVLVLAGYDTDTKGIMLAKELNIEDRFISLGFRYDVPALLDMADYFVLSSNLEGIAGCLLQAMAKGKVVLSTLAGGIGEYLKDGYNGFAVSVGDFGSYKLRMEQMLALTTREYSLIAKNAMETTVFFSIDKTTERYMQLFNELTQEEAPDIRPVLSPDMGGWRI